MLNNLEQGYLTFNHEGIIDEGATKITEDFLEATLAKSKREKIKISVRHPHTLCDRTKPKVDKVHFMDQTKHNLNFSKTKVRNNFSSPTCARLLTNCKYQSIIQY